MKILDYQILSSADKNILALNRFESEGVSKNKRRILRRKGLKYSCKSVRKIFYFRYILYVSDFLKGIVKQITNEVIQN